MLLEVEGALASLLPEAFGGRSLSLVRIRTTRPVYLVFLPGAAWPSCVVQFGPENELRPLDDVLTTLHKELPDCVGGALACAPIDGSAWVLVQQGMPGVPWFRLRETLRDLEAWLTLRARAVQTLERLHTAIRTQRRWLSVVDLGVEISRQMQSYVDQQPTVSAVQQRLSAVLRSEAVLPRTAWFHQHGDYCLNNILVDDSALSIVDFEEFGQTTAPLHDEFSLAFSFNEFMTEVAGAPTFAEHILACITPSLSAHPALLPYRASLFVHHLLWRIAQCGSRPTRARVRARLAALFEGTLEPGGLERLGLLP